MKKICLYGRELNVTDEMMYEYSFVKKYALPITDKAAKKMLETYDNYHSLEKAVRYLMHNKEECYKAAAKAYVDKLHEDDKKGFDYAVEDFLYEYYSLRENLAIDKLYELIVDSYNGLTHKKISAEYHRDLRKASRSRMYGTGTSITKAFEASAIAGTFNLFTGLAHSIFNAVDGAITDSSIESDMETVYKKCRNLIYDCAFSDVYVMRYIYFLNIEHEPFYIYREKALKIKKAIDNGDVPKHRLAEQVAEVLFLMPENWTLYLWAFNLVGNPKNELVEYADFFGQIKATAEIAHAQKEIERKHEQVKKQQELEQARVRAEQQRQEERKKTARNLFGDKAEDITKNYSSNEFYTIFIDDPKASYEELAIAMFHSAKKSLERISRYIWTKDTHYFNSRANRIRENFQKINSYTIPNSEIPIMLFLLEFEGTLMFTDSGNLYCSLALEKSSQIHDMIFSYSEIRSFKFSQPSLGLSSAYLRINQSDSMSLSCDEAVFKKLKSMVEIFTLKSHLEDGTLAVLLAADRVDNVFANTKRKYEFKQLVYFYTNDIPSINIFSWALSDYAKLAKGEAPFTCYYASDSTKRRDGLVVTNFGVHICNKGEKPVFIPHNKLKEVHFYEGLLGNELKLNGIEINAPKLSKNDLHNLYSLIADVADGLDSLTLSRNITDANGRTSHASSIKKTTPKTFVEQLRAEYSFSSHIYYYDFDEKSDKKIQKKFQTALSTYVKLTPSEVPLLLFDSTVFGSAKEGFVLTTRGIHINADEQKMKFITYGNLSVSQENKDLITNGKPISMIPLSTEQVSKVVDLVKRCKLYSLRDYSFENLIASTNPTEKSKPISSDTKVPTTSRQEAETKKTLVSKSAVDDKTDPKAFVREHYIKYTFRHNVYWYDFGESKDKKIQKKFRNALDSYAKLSTNEIPLVLFDSTVFGSAKDGFVLTTKGIHIHEYPTDAFIIYSDLKVQQSEKDKTHLKINSTEFSMIYEEEVVRFMELINLCKYKFQTYQQLTFVGTPEYNSYHQSVAGVSIDFKTDFAEVDALLNGNKDMYALKTKLMFIRRKAENQRAAAAMNELASYYKKLGEYIQAEECSELAGRFSR